MSGKLSFTSENDKIVAFIYDDKTSSPHRAEMDVKTARALVKSLKNSISLAEVRAGIPAMQQSDTDRQKRKSEKPA